MLDDDPGQVPYTNFGTAQLKLLKGTQIGLLKVLKPTADAMLVKDLQMEKVYLKETDLSDKAPFILNPDKDDSAEDADISLYWGEDYTDKMKAVIGKHKNLFRPELGLFNDDIRMPLRFQDKRNVDGLKQNPYSISRRNRVEYSKILNSLTGAGRLEKVPLS